VWGAEDVDDDGLTDLPRCAGPATAEDLERDAEHRRRRAEAKLVARRLIKSHDLPMKVVGVDYLDPATADEELVVLYFTAPQRVDFRVLVGDLARALRSRIDLRQVGSRDAARLSGGIGNCGRDLCCASFLKDFEPVSLRMAKAQDLPANPMRISGACGRLLCCLKYEHPLYAEFAREVPAVGAAVTVDGEAGTVVAHQVPADAVVVRMSAGGALSTCSRASVCGSRHAYEGRAESAAPAPSVASSTPATPAEPGSGPSRRPRHRRRRTDPRAE
jgi:cell fate regulator YaaT (PSP1 superfamily)